MVGVANPDVYAAGGVTPQGQSQVSPELAKAMMGKAKTMMSSAKPLGTGPVSAPQMSSVGGISSAPPVAPMTGLSAPTTGAPAASGGGWGQMAAKAGPWAALAAAIVANESKQRGDGNRPDDKKEHLGEMLSGKVLERDADRYLPNNAFGDFGRKVASFGNPQGLAKKLRGWF